MHSTHSTTRNIAVFRSSDTDGDGMISDNELRTLVSALNSGQVARASDVSAVFDFL